MDGRVGNVRRVIASGVPVGLSADIHPVVARLVPAPQSLSLTGSRGKTKAPAGSVRKKGDFDVR